MRRQRVEADPSDRFIERLLGLELTQTQVDRGTNFVNGVLERADTAGLGRLWEDSKISLLQMKWMLLVCRLFVWIFFE